MISGHASNQSDMDELIFTSHGLDDTDQLGRGLAELLPDGSTVALIGALGTGKTRLVRAIGVAAGIAAEEITSPTFVLCHEYHGRRTLYHLDVYRLNNEEEFLGLGPEEYFESPGITVIEWGDRVRNCLPPERIEIHLTTTGSESRVFRIVPIGKRYEKTVELLRNELECA